MGSAASISASAMTTFPDPRTGAFHDIDTGDLLLFHTEGMFGRAIQDIRGPWCVSSVATAWTYLCFPLASWGTNCVLVAASPLSHMVVLCQGPHCDDREAWRRGRQVRRARAEFSSRDVVVFVLHSAAISRRCHRARMRLMPCLTIYTCWKRRASGCDYTG